MAAAVLVGAGHRAEVTSEIFPDRAFTGAVSWVTHEAEDAAGRGDAAISG